VKWLRTGRLFSTAPHCRKVRMTDMFRMRVIVANEPRAYREAIGLTLVELSPELEVTIVAPEELDGAVRRLCPHMVLCSELSAVVQAQAVTWIMLYPNGQPRVAVCIDGQETHPVDLAVPDLVEIVERTRGLVQAVSLN
jgi:hypothetical protein